MIKMLRYLGCILPIELWYMGKEINHKMSQLIEEIPNVKCINAYDFQKISPIKTLNSWELKIYAIKNSSFTNILFLDADNVPVSDPTFLFGSKQYLEFGALFWPDRDIITTLPEVWNKLSIQNAGREFESGQLLINKNKCIDAINYAYDLNNDSDIFYKYFFGDKDIFRAAWLKTNSSYYVMPNPKCLYDFSIYYHHDFDNNILFQHRTGCKWELKTTNISPNNFIHKKQCNAFLNELRQKWDGIVRKLPNDFEPSELNMYNELISNDYNLIIGKISKNIKFYSNFKTNNFSGSETNWMIDTNKDGEVRLSLGTKTRKTCYLTGSPLSGLYLYQNRPDVTLTKCL
jgi:hypothetical protein